MLCRSFSLLPRRDQRSDYDCRDHDRSLFNGLIAPFIPCFGVYFRFIPCFQSYPNLSQICQISPIYPVFVTSSPVCCRGRPRRRGIHVGRHIDTGRIFPIYPVRPIYRPRFPNTPAILIWYVFPKAFFKICYSKIVRPIFQNLFVKTISKSFSSKTISKSFFLRTISIENDFEIVLNRNRSS